MRRVLRRRGRSLRSQAPASLARGQLGFFESQNPAWSLNSNPTGWRARRYSLGSLGLGALRRRRDRDDWLPWSRRDATSACPWSACVGAGCALGGLDVQVNVSSRESPRLSGACSLERWPQRDFPDPRTEFTTPRPAGPIEGGRRLALLGSPQETPDLAGALRPS